MRWRELKKADVPHCLSANPQHLGAEIVGHSTAIKIWQDLPDHPSFAAITIESIPPIAGQRSLGFGASVFVNPDFANSEFQNPKPGLNSRIIAGIASGQPVLLSKAELRTANSGPGLHSLVLCGTWRDDILNQEQTAEAQMLLACSFAELHAGYRVNRFLAETIGQHQIDFAVSSGVWRMVKEFKEEGRALFALTRSQGFEVPGSVVNVMFQYREPVLGLREVDQKLLKAALSGATDDELASALDVSRASVKKGWVSLFARIADAGIDILPEMRDGEKHSVRGKQKRHHVIAYMRSHPEELRPHNLTKRATT